MGVLDAEGREIVAMKQGDVINGGSGNGNNGGGSSLLDNVLNKMLDLGGKVAEAEIAEKYQTYQKDGNTGGVYPSGQPAGVTASTPGYTLSSATNIMPLIIGGVVLLIGAVLVFKLLRK